MGIFNKSRTSYFDFSSIRIDLLKMLREMERIGFTRIITTPLFCLPLHLRGAYGKIYCIFT